MRRFPTALGVLVCACGLAVTGCHDGGSKPSSHSQWATLEGELVSLSLPDSFKGGDPSDPEAMAALEGIAASNPDPRRVPTCIPI